MHLIRILFKIALIVIRLNVLFLMFKPFFLAEILGSWMSFSWRRLMFTCVRSVLRPERSLLRYKLDPSMLYSLASFPNGHFCWRYSIPKAVFKDLRNLFNASSSWIICDHRNLLFNCKLHFRCFEKWMSRRWRSWNLNINGI